MARCGCAIQASARYVPSNLAGDHFEELAFICDPLKDTTGTVASETLQALLRSTRKRQLLRETAIRADL
jgi:hypothetical protein